MSGEYGLRPVRVAAIHELVIDEIRRAVEMWTYRPGQNLPSERDMAEMLGVSRNTIRTATAILESEGFLSVKRGRGGGYVVQDPAFADDRGEELRRRPELVLDVWDYRVAIDVGVVRLAAERRTVSDLEVLADLASQMVEAGRDYARNETLEAARRFQALDSQFYLTLARATRNDLLVDGVLDARRRLWIAFSSYLTKLDPRSPGRNVGILEAIELQDQDLAEKRMREHLGAGRTLFESWLAEPDSQPLTPEAVRT
jgi:GntR family transcriptional repressor for pyruvate dehydrogenase complex